MKITRLFATSLAASALLLAACDKKTDESAGGAGSGGATVSEKDALERFKKDGEEIKAMTKAGKDSKDPMAQLTMVKPMLAKMQAIKTDGLPADLKAAWGDMKAKIAEMAAIFKDMPDKKEEVMAWAQKNFADPAMGEKMKKLGEEGKVAGEKLKEIAKKYNLDMDMGD